MGTRFTLLAVLLLALALPSGAIAGDEPPPLPPETEQEALSFVRLVAPFRIEDVRALKQADPTQYAQRLRRYLDRKRDLDELKRSDPARYELRIDELSKEQRSLYLAEQVRAAKEPQVRQKLAAELAALLDDLFDVRSRTKAAQIGDLEAELTLLKQALRDRQANKAAIVRQRLLELTGETEALQW